MKNKIDINPEQITLVNAGGSKPVSNKRRWPLLEVLWYLVNQRNIKELHVSVSALSIREAMV